MTWLEGIALISVLALFIAFYVGDRMFMDANPHLRLSRGHVLYIICAVTGILLLGYVLASLTASK